MRRLCAAILLLVLSASAALADDTPFAKALAAARAESFEPYCGDVLRDPQSVVCRATSKGVPAEAAASEIARE